MESWKYLSLFKFSEWKKWVQYDQDQSEFINCILPYSLWLYWIYTVSTGVNRWNWTVFLIYWYYSLFYNSIQLWRCPCLLKMVRLKSVFSYVLSEKLQYMYCILPINWVRVGTQLYWGHEWIMHFCNNKSCINLRYVQSVESIYSCTHDNFPQYLKLQTLLILHRSIRPELVWILLAAAWVTL